MPDRGFSLRWTAGLGQAHDSSGRDDKFVAGWFMDSSIPDRLVSIDFKKMDVDFSLLCSTFQ
jgi:hypothetical protein